MSIDVTARYDTPEFFTGARSTWALDRAKQPVRAIVLHHTAGWYGAPLSARATEAQERAQVDALARDHQGRFGIGPGYHYLAFPSGRLYLAGRLDTQRAHTKGRNPAGRVAWNIEAIGICAFGNFEVDTPPAALLDALRAAVEEARRFAGAAVAVHPHGRTPSVDSAGGVVAQATACPGKHLLTRLDDLATAPPVPEADVRAELITARARIDAALGLLDRPV